jgi:thiol-disulfide isomerase/thioredoxin
MLRFSLIYTAVAAIAIAVAAAPAPAGNAALEALRDGTMKKLVFHSSPKPAGNAGYVTQDGTTASLTDHHGRYVLLNFWATWCAPCRKEMPGLDAIQAEFGGAKFEVLTIATGRNPPGAMKKFFDETGVTNLPLHRDPKQKLARQMGVLGLPVSVLLDPEGREIARMVGDAEWGGESGRAIIRALIADPD